MFVGIFCSDFTDDNGHHQTEQLMIFHVQKYSIILDPESMLYVHKLDTTKRKKKKEKRKKKKEKREKN